MNTNVAVGAVLVSRIGHVVSPRQLRHPVSSPAERAGAVVALETESEYNGPSQEPGVSGTMGVMAHFAALHTNGWMLKCKRTALIEVAV
jgi:hypothetical protein